MSSVEERFEHLERSNAIYKILVRDFEIVLESKIRDKSYDLDRLPFSELRKGKLEALTEIESEWYKIKEVLNEI